MIPDPKSVLQLAERIVQTETLLKELKQQWDGMFAASGPPENRVIARLKREGSLASSVEAIVTAQPRKTFTIAEVAELVHGDPLKVGRALFSLAGRNHIENRGRGLYGAKSLPLTASSAA